MSEVPANPVKSVLVIARRDANEAMRVAAGISIFDHNVTLVLANGILEVTPDVEKNAELLALSDIDTWSLCEDPEVPALSMADFYKFIEDSHFVINV